MIAQSPERAEAQTNYSPLYEPRQGHIFDSCCLSLQSLDVFHKLRPISHGNMKFHLCSQMTNGLAFDSRVQTLMKQNSSCVVSANGRCRIWPCARPQGLTPSLASTWSFLKEVNIKSDHGWERDWQATPAFLSPTSNRQLWRSWVQDGCWRTWLTYV